MHSPDDLDKFLQVTSPGVWIVILACAALLAGLIIWGFFGTVASNVTTSGVRIDDRVVCFLSAEDVGHVHAGDSVNVDGSLMHVESISVVPVSKEEAKQLLGSEYLADTLVTTQWAYIVSISGEMDDLEEDICMNIRITTEQVSPIRLILGGE